MSEREQLDLDAIEALIIEFSYSGALRRPYVERVNLTVEIAKSAPALVARVRELEGQLKASHERISLLEDELPGVLCVTTDADGNIIEETTSF